MIKKPPHFFPLSPIFRNFKNNKKVIVPIHNKDIPTGTVNAIIKDAGIKI